MADDDTKTILGYLKGKAEAAETNQKKLIESVTKIGDDFETHIRKSIQRKADQDNEIKDVKRETREAKKEINDHKKEHKADADWKRGFVMKIVGTVVAGILLALFLVWLNLT